MPQPGSAAFNQLLDKYRNMPIVDGGGGFADIRRITGVTPRGNGYDVTGTIDQRSSYSARDGRERSFTCAFDNGRVSDVRFGTSA